MARASAQMRDEQHVVETEQIGMNRGLALVDVERRAGQQMLLQRPSERGLVDDGSARGVDEVRRPFHARERLPIDEMSRFRRQWHVQ